eukprot:SAG31_NODE_767_length_12232_cov_6.917827_10_plen_224_part_00
MRLLAIAIALLVAGFLAVEAIDVPAARVNCTTHLADYCQRPSSGGHNRTILAECWHCVTFDAAWVELFCTPAEEAKFCRGPRPSVTNNCTRALEADCGKDRQNFTRCSRCVFGNFTRTRRLQQVDKCTSQELDGYCGPEPPPPPPPPVPVPVICAQTLAHYCGTEKPPQKCVTCLEECLIFKPLCRDVIKAACQGSPNPGRAATQWCCRTQPHGSYCNSSFDQ